MNIIRKNDVITVPLCEENTKVKKINKLIFILLVNLKLDLISELRFKTNGK